MKLFSVFKKDLLILLRNRSEMLVLFLMPLAFIIPISFALGSGDGYGINRNNQMILLPVADYDNGPRAQSLRSAIGESLKLEIDYGADWVNTLGLSDDPDCAQVVGGQSALKQETATPNSSLPTATTAAATPVLTAPAGTAPAGTETAAATAYPAAGGAGETTAPAYPAEKTPGTATVENRPTGAVETTPSVAKNRTPKLVKNPACIEKAGRIMLARSQRSAILIIPQGFSAMVDQGKQVTVTLVYDPAGDPVRQQQVEGVVKGATMKLSIQNQLSSGLNQLNELAALAPENVKKAVNQQAAQPAEASQNPAIWVQKTSPSNARFTQVPDTYQQTIPGYTVMYVFFIITSMSGSIRQERLTGTFRRLLSAPVGRAELLGGKMLASVVVGLAQVFLLFGIGALLFRLGLGNDPLAFFLLTIAMVVAAAAIGLAASTTMLRGGGLVAPLVIAALLGGCMFPLDLMPPVLRSLSFIVPHSWALTGYQNLMVRGLGLQEVFPQIAVLLGFALVFFLIAVRRFDFEHQEAA